MFSLSLFFSLFLITKAAFCPPGSVDYRDDAEQIAECVIALDSMTDFDTAQRTCQLIGGELVQPTNIMENIIAVSQNVQANETSTPEYSCAMYQGGDFYWYSSPCNVKRPFICTFSDTKAKEICPDNWSYFRQTGACYHHPMNLIASVMSNFNLTACASRFETVIGLDQATWSDSSPFDYDNRASVSYYYGINNDPYCFRSNWNPHPYNYATFASYVCKKPAHFSVSVSQLLEKIKLEKASNPTKVKPH
ncbi:unnamed protein product, partial [Mesorhabditis belari]|uniref:Uncharacterized protein n=1 Tax=Mesorhabditis belari TaxID=2138241 RepID=A0AAF3J5W8_9BILA